MSKLSSTKTVVPRSKTDQARRTVIKKLALGTGATALTSLLTSQPMGINAALAAEEPVVETRYGKIRGALNGNVYAFKGVRYGAPTGGPNRFMPPQKPAPWPGVQDALEFGNSAPAVNPNPPASSGSPQIILYQLAQQRPAGSPSPAPANRPPKEDEDCLFLNVWTSAINDSSKRPVMVWLHGGVFAAGSGSTVNGSPLASRGDVVVVSLNHRLNVLGYSHFADLDSNNADFKHSGNVGMLDIIAALEWVRDNIERFGGDPKRVMVFGESGGGMKTSFLLASPRAKGLMQRAAIQSGPGLKMMERAAATRVSEMLLAELGLKPNQLNELKTLPLEKIMAARYAVQAKLPTGYFTDLVSFAPVIDPDLLPRRPFQPDATPLSADVPLLIGSSETEMIFFMGNDAAAFTLDEAGLQQRVNGFLGTQAEAALSAYRKAWPGDTPSDLYMRIWSDFSVTNAVVKQAERKAAQKKAATYLYQFNWHTPVLGGKLKSLHTLINPFIWNDIDGSRALTGGGEEAKALARQLSEAWVSFAATGNPNSTKSSLPEWPAYEASRRATMLFNQQSSVANDPYQAQREILNRVLI